MELNINFRSCDEIVKFSEKLINSRNVKSANEQSIFGARSLVYIEYETPEDCVGDYAKLLEKNNCMTGENRILVRQNSLRLQLEKSTHNDYDEKEPLIVAAQLWQQGSKLQMTLALELAGKQISRWFGGSRTKSNYYCPKEIVSVFRWRIFLMKVLMEILQSRNLSNFKLTYGKWHEYARKELGDILRNNYSLIADYDDVKDRNFNNLITGKTFKVSSGNGSIVIGDLDEKAKSVIPIMTIHGSKGCTFDTTLVISSKDAKSIGGHWKKHWINGEGEAKRIGYVASTRARHMLVWGVPKLNDTDRELLESYGFINVKKII
jgi:DNA helicase-2/ATP-dependent DNA helicase PcrA